MGHFMLFVMIIYFNGEPTRVTFVHNVDLALFDSSVVTRAVAFKFVVWHLFSCSLFRTCATDSRSNRTDSRATLCAVADFFPLRISP